MNPQLRALSDDLDTRLPMRPKFRVRRHVEAFVTECPACLGAGSIELTPSDDGPCRDCENWGTVVPLCDCGADAVCMIDSSYFCRRCEPESESV